MMKAFRILAAILFPGLISVAHAQLNVEIIGGAGKQFPIAIVPFGNEASLPQKLTEVIAADLGRSGQFKTVDTSSINPVPTEPSQVDYGDIRGRNADAVAIGSVAAAADGRIEIRFRLMDAIKQTQITGASLNASPSQLRATAHKIADIIYEAITGDKGIFSTRIAYIVKQGRRYQLQVADADGFGAQTVLASNEPILSPTWSPDGNRLAYVSFESQRPTVIVQNLATGTRKVVASFRGNNSAPAWSPDGSKLAVALSKDGGTQIYLISSEGGGSAQRLTNSTGIDTEPTFSADGKWIAFTSDRGGSPQIYRMPATGGEAQRLTFAGTYAVSPDWSPDGKTITYLARDNGFHVAVLDLGSGQTMVLTETTLDERPRFAPNGKLILYATRDTGRGVLATVSVDGRYKTRLSAAAGDVREPTWGPLPKN
jgi:TolB protein